MLTDSAAAAKKADGQPNVEIDVAASDITLRGLTIQSVANTGGLSISPVTISPLFASNPNTTSLSSIAVVGMNFDGTGPLSVFNQATGAQAMVSDVLVSRNRLSNAEVPFEDIIAGDLSQGGIRISNVKDAGMVSGVTIAENLLLGETSVEFRDGRQAITTQAVITDNTFESGGDEENLTLIPGSVCVNADSGESVSEVQIRTNSFRRPPGSRFSSAPAVVVTPGSFDPDNTIMLDIVGNQIENINDFTKATIDLIGGMSNGENVVEATIAGNQIINTINGIALRGGELESSDNLVLGDLFVNEIQVSPSTGGIAFEQRGISLEGGNRTAANTVDTVIEGNLVSASVGDGVSIIGGTTRASDLQNTEQGDALENFVDGFIADNTIQGSGIAVFGGLDNRLGEVSGNVAELEIVGNTADSFVCEDGLAGNTAECIFSSNTSLSAPLGQQDFLKKTGQGQTGRRDRSIASVQRLTHYRAKVARKEQRLRERAAKMWDQKDQKMRQRLIQLCDRLEALQDKLTARMAKSPSVRREE